MKKACLVIVTVAAYCFIEAAFLLSHLLPDNGCCGWSSRHALLAFGQLLILPGTAVLYSRLIYGRQGWVRRALIVFLVGTVGVPAMVVIFLLPLGLLAWVADLNSVLGLVLLPLVVGGMLWGFLFAIRKSGERSIQTEASRWLAERQAGISSRDRRWRSRGIGWSLWIAPLTVLTVFLFFPETWGLITHIQQTPGELVGYDVTVPPTWVILSHYTNSTTGASGVDGIAGRGMGLEVRRYLHFGDVPLSSWGVDTDSVDEARYRSPLSNNEAVAQRDFQIGKGKLTCAEYHPSWGRPMRADAEPLAVIECSGPNRLRATFTGEQIHIPTFYGMVASIVPGLPR